MQTNLHLKIHWKRELTGMAQKVINYDLSHAVTYHYDKFPPENIDYTALIKPLAAATAALARYDQMLMSMHNSSLLLAPLRRQEAVISSRMEGTVSTLDEVLQYEADHGDDNDLAGGSARSEAIEVYLYSAAMRRARDSIKQGQPISGWLIRSAHKHLLRHGRGTETAPGEFKTKQNYLADKMKRAVLFTPISPERLQDGMEKLFEYIDNDMHELLIRTAVSHVEFEALHPFDDGNGRIGRMLIPLILWKHGALSEPYFYLSAYFEKHRDEYIDRMRNVSAADSWTDWIKFFLESVQAEAGASLAKAEEIRALYESMKQKFRDSLSSKWSISVLDLAFSSPIFRSVDLTKQARIPPQSAPRLAKILVEEGILKIIRLPSGRRPALYAFEPLLKLIRG